ncbi:MAG: S8 family serine peptidase, partial [Ignisphaera sp.]|nr:S8 family serine peptidase [Ignisphaera sp.]
MKSYINVLLIALLAIYSVQGFVSVVTVFAGDAKEFIVYFNSVDEVNYARSLGCAVENIFWGINAALLTCPSGAVSVLRLSGVFIAPNINVSISSTFSSVRILGSLEKVSQSSGTQVNVSVAWSWAVSRVGADLVWRYLHVNGEGSVIAVLDTGIDPTHPLLLGKVAGWIEFDRKGRPVCSSPRDTYGHGTWVASIAAGGDTERYIFGVAPKAKIIAALVLPGGYGSAAQILAGLNWVLNPVDCRGNSLNISRVAVVSMSFGESNNYTNVFLPAIEKLIEKGIVPVAAIGNEGPYSSANPGNIWGVIGVGATDFNDNVAWFSSYEEVEWPEPPSNWSFKDYYPKTYMKPDVVAPGVDVPGAWMGELIAIGSGTSASTPIVSAIAAMVSNILYAK